MSKGDKNQILDEAFDSLAGLVSGGLELASGAGDEAKALLRTRLARLIEGMDLVRAEELEVVQAQLDALRARLDALEGKKND